MIIDPESNEARAGIEALFGRVETCEWCGTRFRIEPGVRAAAERTMNMDPPYEVAWWEYDYRENGSRRIITDGGPLHHCRRNGDTRVVLISGQRP